MYYQCVSVNHECDHNRPSTCLFAAVSDAHTVPHSGVYACVHRNNSTCTPAPATVCVVRVFALMCVTSERRAPLQLFVLTSTQRFLDQWLSCTSSRRQQLNSSPSLRFAPPSFLSHFQPQHNPIGPLYITAVTATPSAQHSQPNFLPNLIACSRFFFLFIFFSKYSFRVNANDCSCRRLTRVRRTL